MTESNNDVIAVASSGMIDIEISLNKAWHPRPSSFFILCSVGDTIVRMDERGRVLIEWLPARMSEEEIEDFRSSFCEKEGYCEVFRVYRHLDETAIELDFFDTLTAEKVAARYDKFRLKGCLVKVSACHPRQPQDQGNLCCSDRNPGQYSPPAFHKEDRSFQTSSGFDFLHRDEDFVSNQYRSHKDDSPFREKWARPFFGARRRSPSPRHARYYEQPSSGSFNEPNSYETNGFHGMEDARWEDDEFQFRRRRYDDRQDLPVRRYKGSGFRDGYKRDYSCDRQFLPYDSHVENPSYKGESRNCFSERDQPCNIGNYNEDQEFDQNGYGSDEQLSPLISNSSEAMSSCFLDTNVNQDFSVRARIISRKGGRISYTYPKGRQCRQQMNKPYYPKREKRGPGTQEVAYKGPIGSNHGQRSFSRSRSGSASSSVYQRSKVPSSERLPQREEGKVLNREQSLHNFIEKSVNLPVPFPDRAAMGTRIKLDKKTKLPAQERQKQDNHVERSMMRNSTVFSSDQVEKKTVKSDNASQKCVKLSGKTYEGKKTCVLKLPSKQSEQSKALGVSGTKASQGQTSQVVQKGITEKPVENGASTTLSIPKGGQSLVAQVGSVPRSHFESPVKPLTAVKCVQNSSKEPQSVHTKNNSSCSPTFSALSSDEKQCVLVQSEKNASLVMSGRAGHAGKPNVAPKKVDSDAAAKMQLTLLSKSSDKKLSSQSPTETLSPRGCIDLSSSFGSDNVEKGQHSTTCLDAVVADAKPLAKITPNQSIAKACSDPVTAADAVHLEMSSFTASEMCDLPTVAPQGDQASRITTPVSKSVEKETGSDFRGLKKKEGQKLSGALPVDRSPRPSQDYEIGVSLTPGRIFDCGPQNIAQQNSSLETNLCNTKEVSDPECKQNNVFELSSNTVTSAPVCGKTTLAISVGGISHFPPCTPCNDKTKPRGICDESINASSQPNLSNESKVVECFMLSPVGVKASVTDDDGVRGSGFLVEVEEGDSLANETKTTEEGSNACCEEEFKTEFEETGSGENENPELSDGTGKKYNDANLMDSMVVQICVQPSHSSGETSSPVDSLALPSKQAPAAAFEDAEHFPHKKLSNFSAPDAHLSAGDEERPLNVIISLQSTESTERETRLPDSSFSRKEENASEGIRSVLNTENKVVSSRPRCYSESASDEAPTLNDEVKLCDSSKMSDILGAQVSSSSVTPKTGERDMELDNGSICLQPLSKAAQSCTSIDELKTAEINVQQCEQDTDFSKEKSSNTCLGRLDSVESQSMASRDVASSNTENYVKCESNNVFTNCDIVLGPDQSSNCDQKCDDKGCSSDSLSGKQECEDLAFFVKEAVNSAALNQLTPNTKMNDCPSAPDSESVNEKNPTKVKDCKITMKDGLSPDCKKEDLIFEGVQNSEMSSDVNKFDCNRSSHTFGHSSVVASTFVAADEAIRSELIPSHVKKEGVMWKRVVKVYSEASSSSSHEHALERCRAPEIPVKSVSHVHSPERDVLLGQSRAVSILPVAGNNTSNSSQTEKRGLVRSCEAVSPLANRSSQLCSNTRCVEVNQPPTVVKGECLVGEEVGDLEKKREEKGSNVTETGDFSQPRGESRLKSAVADVIPTSPTITTRNIVLLDTVRGYSEFGRQAQGDLDEEPLIQSTEEIHQVIPSLLSVAPAKKKPLGDHLEGNSPGRSSAYGPEYSKENTWSSYGRDNWGTYDRTVERLSSFDIDLRHILKVRKRKQRDEIQVTRYTDGSQQDLRLKLRKSNAPELTVLISQNQPGASEGAYSDFEIDRRKVKQRRNRINKEDEGESRKKKKSKRKLRDANALLGFPLVETGEEISEKELKRRLRKLAKQRRYQEKMNRVKESRLRSCISSVEELVSKNLTSFHDDSTEQDSRLLKLNQGEYFTAVSDDEMDFSISTKSSEGSLTAQSPIFKENVTGKLSSLAFRPSGDNVLEPRQASPMLEYENQVPWFGATVLAGVNRKGLGSCSNSSTEHEMRIVHDSATSFPQLEESPVIDDNNNSNINTSTDLLFASARTAVTVLEDSVEKATVLSRMPSPPRSQKSETTRPGLVKVGRHDLPKSEDTFSELGQPMECESSSTRKLLPGSTSLDNDECNEIAIQGDCCYEEMTHISSLSHHSGNSGPEPAHLTFIEEHHGNKAPITEARSTVSDLLSINKLHESWNKAVQYVNIYSEQSSASPLERPDVIKTDSVSPKDVAAGFSVSCHSSVNGNEEQRCHEDEECFYSQISSVSTLGYDALSESDSLLAYKETEDRATKKSSEDVTNEGVQGEHAQQIGEDLLDRFTKDSRAITAIVSMLLRKMPDMEDILALGLADVLDELGDECVRDFKSRCASFGS